MWYLKAGSSPLRNGNNKRRDPGPPGRGLKRRTVTPPLEKTFPVEKRHPPHKKVWLRLNYKDCKATEEKKNAVGALTTQPYLVLKVKGVHLYFSSTSGPSWTVPE